MSGAVPHIPELEIIPTPGQIFMFSAATWNRHHIHFSKDAAVNEGHADIVVQRALLGNFMARHLASWLGNQSGIRDLSWKVMKSALPGNVLRCQGSAISSELRDGAEWIKCDLKIVDDAGAIVASGTATVVR